MRPVMLDVPKRTAALMRRRAMMPKVQRWAPDDAVRISRSGLIGADPGHYPIESLVGADETPSHERAIELRIYEDAPGKYRALAVVPLTLRDRATGAPRRVVFALQAHAELVEGATVGADGLTASLLVPVLDKVANIVSHPLAALAAAATVLIPGVGPAYLVGYTIGQSLLGYAARRVRE